jgi:formylmethanofuran dehydrogenase subunit E
MLPTQKGCHTCGEENISPNIEAFEISGKIVCDECADEIFEDNSQFGAGA